MKGLQLSLHIYDIKRTQEHTLQLTGFSTVYKEEFTVIIDSSQNVGIVAQFNVYSERGKVLVPTKGTFVFDKDPEYEVQDNVVLISTIVIFDPDESTECWSVDYGWIFVPSTFHGKQAVTAEVPHRAHIKRDKTENVSKRGLLFTVVSDSHFSDANTPKKLGFIDDFRQAKIEREKKRSEGKWSLEKAGSSQWQIQESWEERRQNEKKKLADSVSLFLILDTKNNGRWKGSAWAMKLRTIGLNTDVINATSSPLEPGVWYEGVVKYSNYVFNNCCYLRWFKRMDNFKDGFNGFGVDKVWRRTDIPPFKTEAIKGSNRVTMELDVNFSDLMKYQPNKNKRVVPSSKIERVDVPTSIFDQYQNTLVTCRLVNRRDRPVDPDDKADWTVDEVIQVKGMVEKEIAGWSTSGQAPAEVGQNNVQADDDDDGDMPNFAEGTPYMEDEDHLSSQTNQIFLAAPLKINGRPPTNVSRPEPSYPQPNYQTTDNGNSSAGDRTTMYHEHEIHEKTERVDITLVVEASEECALIYAPRYDTIVTFEKVYPGDWVAIQMSKLCKPQGSVSYLATSTRLTSFDYPPEKRILGKKVQLKVDLDIRDRRSRPNDIFSIPNDLLTEVFTADALLIEGTGDIVRLSDIPSGKMDFWAEYKERSGCYRWELVSMCAPSETRTRGPMTSQKSPSPARDSRNFLSQYSRNTPSQNADSSTPRFPSTQSSSRKNNSDHLFLRAWQIPEVRKTVKNQDFELYEDIENLVNDMKSSQVSARRAETERYLSRDMDQPLSSSFQNGPHGQNQSSSRY